MASFRKRGDRWQVQVRRQGATPLTKTFTLKADAEQWARQTEARLDQGDIPMSRRTLGGSTLATLLTRYRAEVTPTKRGHLQERYRLDQLLKDKLAALPLEKLSSQHIASYRDQRLRSVQGVTVRRELALLRHVIEVARIDWGIPIAGNPVADIRLPRLPAARNRRLSPQEHAVLMDHVERSRARHLGPVVRFALETGMRRGEILAARWEHVDWAAGTLWVPETKTGYARKVPLSPAARELLSTVRPACPMGPSGHVFPTSANAIRLSWERLVRRIGIEDLHFHDLRHEAISRFFERGLSIPEVALISGHRDFRMLFRYTHLRAEDVVAKLA